MTSTDFQTGDLSPRSPRAIRLTFDGMTESGKELQRQASLRLDLVVSILIAGLIFLGHILYAGLTHTTALGLIVLFSLTGLGLLFVPGIRTPLARIEGLTFPTQCFILLIVLSLLTLAPWLPAAPIWASVPDAAPAVTINKAATLVEIVKLIGLAGVFGLGLIAGGTIQRGKTVIRSIVLLGAIFGTWTILAFLSGAIVQTQPDRLEGHFMNPNTAGCIFGVLLVLTLGLAIDSLGLSARERRNWLGVLVACAVVFLTALLMSASRGAFFATIVGVALLAGLQFRKAKKIEFSDPAIWGSGLAIGSILTVGGGIIGSRLDDSADSASNRIEIWRLHWDAFLTSPWIGTGLGTSESVNLSLITPENFTTLWAVRGLLNLYLQWLQQAGIIGAALMFGCVGSVMFMASRRLRKRTRGTALPSSLLAACAVFIAHGFTDFALEAYSVAATFALILGALHAQSQERILRG